RLRELQEAVDRIGREVHDMALELRPMVLDDLGLGPALEMLVRRWSERVRVPVDVHCTSLGTWRYPADVETTVYRLGQEALTTVARHARAARVSVVVEHREGHLIAIVEDDGDGFDVDAGYRPASLGLAGMRERVALVDGTLQLESSRGAGTTVRARIPC